MTQLRNGIKIPDIGFGTYNLNCSEKSLVQIIRSALINGYRFFDTAHSYGSESDLGIAIEQAIQEGLVVRDELFIETKYHSATPYGYYDALNQFEESINKLRCDYIDAYLIHQPVPRYSEREYTEKNIEVWQAFEELYYKGKIKAIGVSNFLERHILQIMNVCREAPMINQIEIHPMYQEIGLSRWCQNHGIAVEGWSPLARGEILKKDEILRLGLKYHKTAAQICLRWAIYNGVIPIVAAENDNWMKSNIEVFDFTLSDEDMEQINQLNTNTEHWDLWMYRRQQMY